MKKQEKTNVMRLLDQQKISYTAHFYGETGTVSGVEVAQTLGEPVEQVFKTLVTVGKSGQHYVFVIPAAKELDLRKAAAAAGEKSIEMIKSKELLPLTGYIHGGCSPIGMKKRFPTWVDSSARSLVRFFVSGGRIGCQVELAPADLERMIPLEYAELTA